MWQQIFLLYNKLMNSPDSYAMAICVAHCNIPPDSGHEVTTKLLLKHNLTHAHSGTIDILHPPFLERGNLYTDTKKNKSIEYTST